MIDIEAAKQAIENMPQLFWMFGGGRYAGSRHGFTGLVIMYNLIRALIGSRFLKKRDAFYNFSGIRHAGIQVWHKHWP